MSKIEVFVFDRMMPNECCAAAWLELGGCKTIGLDRGDKWRRPSDIKDICQDKYVVIIGTYNMQNVQEIASVARVCRLGVYPSVNTDQLPTDSITANISIDIMDKGVWNYISSEYNHDKPTLRKICELFDAIRGDKLSHDDRAIVQAVKSGQQNLFIDKLKQVVDSNVTVEGLQAEGRAELRVVDSVCNHWYSQSVRGVIDGIRCRVGHANPFIHDTAELFLDKDQDADIAVVYRIEKSAFRFTILSRKPTEISSASIARRFYGGGSDRIAGFALTLAEGSRLLNEILIA